VQEFEPCAFTLCRGLLGPLTSDPKQNKTPQAQRVVGRKSNSPPPKSAHNHSNLWVGACEWLGTGYCENVFQPEMGCERYR
jgi:hypothetical protein